MILAGLGDVIIADTNQAIDDGVKLKALHAIKEGTFNMVDPEWTLDRKKSEWGAVRHIFASKDPRSVTFELDEFGFELAETLFGEVPEDMEVDGVERKKVIAISDEYKPTFKKMQFGFATGDLVYYFPLMQVFKNENLQSLSSETGANTVKMEAYPDEFGNVCYKWVLTDDAVVPPTFTKPIASGLAPTSATINYNVEHIADVAEMGVCYSGSANPEIGDYKKSLATPTAGTATFTVSGLTAETKYYVRPYVKMNNGNVLYGAQISFVTPRT